MAEKILTPQQELFLASYTNPKSSTFGNALQSGLKAGYTQEYSENITNLLPDWLSENIGDFKMLAKAEKVLNEMLEMPTNVFEVEDNQEVIVSSAPHMKIKQDTAKFVAERLGKKKYSVKSQFENDDGQPITVRIVQYGDNSAP